MKKIIISSVVLMFAPFVSFAQTAAPVLVDTTAAPVATTTTVVVTPGLVPGDFFYFLDRWTEVLNTALTLNKEKKAKLHLEYAMERVKEINEVLKRPEAKLGDVASAKDNFNTQIANATAIVKSEKEKGVDVSSVARELDDELDSTHDELKDTLRNHKDKTSRAEAEIRAKLAALSPNDPQVKGLTQALESITKEKDEVEGEEDDLDNEITESQEAVEEMMGKQLSAQKHIEEALRLKARLEGLAGQLPAGVVAASQDLLNKAKAAEARGDFEAAKQLSKQAKKVFEKAQDAVEEKANEAKERIEDAEKDEEESRANNLEEQLKKSERDLEELDR